MIVTTSGGSIRGYQENNVFLFKGIPYAISKRFEKPEPIKWDETLDCTKFRSMAPQNEDSGTMHTNEDCLNLNIYTPSLNKKLPVLVEIHGGAFQNGSNQKADPFQLIREKEYIYVNINYRLGIFGYLYQDKFKTSGNNGTLDQLMALKWIHENIEFFGGDKNKVTLLGSSAGAKAVGALMIKKEASKYFQQAILISGAYQSVRDIQTAAIITNKFYEILGSKDLENKTVEELLQAQKQLCNNFGSTCMFGPVADGVVIPIDFYDKIDSKEYWSGNAIISSSKNEFVFLKTMVPNLSEIADDIAEGLFGLNAPIAINEWNELSKDITKEDAIVKVVSDYMYRMYTYDMAKNLSKNGSKVYVASTEFEMACHCMDHILALEPRSKLNKYFTQEDKTPMINLGKNIYNAYINFVVSGSPMIKEWLPINKENSQMIWDYTCHVRKIENETCNRFPKYVFKL